MTWFGREVEKEDEKLGGQTTTSIQAASRVMRKHEQVLGAMMVM